MHFNFRNGLENAWNMVATFAPKFLAFLIILVIGYLIAKTLEKVLDKVLQRVGFDRWVERGGVKRALANSKYDAASVLGRLVFYAVMLFTLSAAFGVFGPNPVSDFLKAVVAYLPKLFVAVLIVVIASAIAAGVKNILQNLLGTRSYGRLVANLASGLIVALGVAAALNQLQIATFVVNALLVTVLAMLALTFVVAVGGGGIGPMRERWQQTLTRWDAERPQLVEAVRSAPPMRDQAQDMYDQVHPDRGNEPVAPSEHVAASVHPRPDTVVEPDYPTSELPRQE